MNTDIHALAGAYVLDAVDDVERRAFDRHLEQCESCRADVDDMRAAAARLADPTWSVPPPRLRAEVLAAIGRTRQLPPAASAPPRTAAGPRWRRGMAVAAAAAVLAVGAGSVTYAVQEQRVRDQQVTAAAARAAATAAQARESRIQAILTSPDVVVRTEAMAGGGRVTVASSAVQRAGVVMLAARRAPAADRAFQYWTINGAGPVRGDLLAAGATSDVRVVDGLPGNAAFAVTIERAGSRPTTPTTPTVAVVTLT